MRFLRTVSTRRLLASIAGVVVAVAGGTAIAVAASSGGPVPPRKPLARAIHDALGGPKITGISAQITFTNHLIDSSEIQGTAPLLLGATGRLWLSSDHRLRLELQSSGGDAQVVVNNGGFWVYDPTSNTVYKGSLPQDTTQRKSANKHESIPSVAQIQTDINHLMQRANVSGANPGNVAGQAAYSVRISPQHDGGLLGFGQLAFDAVRGIPLSIGIYARGGTSPVLELRATDISYGKIPSNAFNISTPRGAKVVTVSTPSSHAGARRLRSLHEKKGQKEQTGVANVAKRVHFKLVAPSTLVGLPRRSVSLLSWGGSPAALVTFGQNLGGIAVIEQPASSAKSATPLQSSGSGGRRPRGLNLPSVSINGTSGQELDTALGTLVRFTRGGVTYTVVGSVPPTAAEAAARAL
jgi:outer membrane lipoprotein-sorting protein